MTTIRVSEQTRETLRALAREQGAPMQTIVEQAIELYRRQQVLLATNAAYAALQDNQEQRTALEQEQAEWDATLSDGLTNHY